MVSHMGAVEHTYRFPFILAGTGIQMYLRPDNNWVTLDRRKIPESSIDHQSVTLVSNPERPKRVSAFFFFFLCAVKENL